MDTSRQSFRDQLLDATPRDPTLEAQYRKAVHEMLEMRLEGPWRWFYVFMFFLGLGMAGLFGTVAIVATDLPILGRVMFGAGVVFGLAWAALLGSILKTRRFHQIKHPNAMAVLGWGVVVVTSTLALLAGSQMADPARGTLMIVSTLVFLVFGATFLILARVNQAELNTREKLLEIEYRLAELLQKGEST